jgi:glyoxylase-like metal-dependent hydrolase (beta-lactamase superfamily II)
MKSQEPANRVIQLAEDIWLWPHDPDPDRVQSSIGIISGRNETVLIDAGNSPTLANQLKDVLQKIGLAPVSRIIYTHHHWDHVSGACAFQVPVIAHEISRSILVDEARKPWSTQYLRQEVARNPRLNISYKAWDQAIQDWESFRIVVPDIVFDKSMSLQIGRFTLELEHVGGEHAEDSIVVKVPEAGIMFLGDCFYPPPLHLRTKEPVPSISMLASFAAEPYDLFVEGHDDPFTKGELSDFLEEV